MLAQPPTQITLLQVLRAVDGELMSTACVLRGGPCRWEEVCAVHEPWMQAQEAILGSVDRTSFAGLVATDIALGSSASVLSSPRWNVGSDSDATA